MNRRQLAGASGAALLVGLAGPGKAAELDGELLDRVDALVAHLVQQRAADATMTLDERRDAYARAHREDVAGIASRADVLAAGIARIPACTPEGARAKARAMVWLYGGDDTRQAGAALGNGLLESMLADLTGARTALGPFPARVERPLPPDPDAELLALCRTFHQADHDMHVLPDGGDDAPFIQLYDARLNASGRLELLRPRTMAGRMAKAGVATRLMEEHTHGGAVDSREGFVLATLRHLAGCTAEVTS